MHAGLELGLAPRGLATPIFQSAAFEIERATDRCAETQWGYTRLRNPTVAAAAAKVAALERSERALLLPSGMAAISTTLRALLPPGGTVVASRDLHGETHVLLRRELPRLGYRVAFVDVDDLAGWERELADGADLLFVESISNPMLRVADLPLLARLAHAAGALAVVDSTFASPINLRPVEHGFDFVIHSATKYLNGHGDLVAGAVAGSESLLARVERAADLHGGCLDPHAAFLLERGLKTLAIRMERQNANALELARWLAGRLGDDAVSYPLLESHPDHGLAVRLLAGGSGVVTARVAEGDLGAALVMDSLRMVRAAPSLGGVESLVSAPYATSHAGVPGDARTRAGIVPGTLRIAVGIEDACDLIDDFVEAFGRAEPRTRHTALSRASDSDSDSDLPLDRSTLNGTVGPLADHLPGRPRIASATPSASGKAGRSSRC